MNRATQIHVLVSGCEKAEALRTSMQLHHEPAGIVLSRQALPTVDRTQYAPARGLHKGAYVLAEAKGGPPDVLLLGTGSEVALCVRAYTMLTSEGIRARVVSMPLWELFERQARDYWNEVLPPGVTARVVVEQASTLGWARYVGSKGTVIGMETFGSSAPLKALQRKFGFTPDRVAQAAREQL